MLRIRAIRRPYLQCPFQTHVQSIPPGQFKHFRAEKEFTCLLQPLITEMMQQETLLSLIADKEGQQQPYVRRKIICITVLDVGLLDEEELLIITIKLQVVKSLIYLLGSECIKHDR